MICPHEEDIQRIMGGGGRKKNKQSYVNVLNECLFTLISWLPNSLLIKIKPHPCPYSNGLNAERGPEIVEDFLNVIR